MSEPRLFLRGLARQLEGFAYRYNSEVQLHERLAEVLTALQIPFEREVAVVLPPVTGAPKLGTVGLGPCLEQYAEARKEKDSRFDFLLEGRIVIEVKVAENLLGALRQVERYAKLPQVNGVLLAATHMKSKRIRQDAELHGKPIVQCQLRRQAL